MLAADSTREVEAEKTSQGVRARVHGGAGQAAQGLCVRFLQKEPVAQRGPPRLWPLLSVAMDRGSDGLAACACLQRAKLGNVEALPDPACGVSNDVTLGLQRTEVWAHSALMLAVWTPVRGGRRQPVELLQECAWSHRNRQRLKHEQASAFPSRQLHHTHHTPSVQKVCSAAQPDASTLWPRPRLRVRGTLRQVGGNTKTGKHVALSLSDPLAFSCAGTG